MSLITLMYLSSRKKIDRYSLSSALSLCSLLSEHTLLVAFNLLLEAKYTFSNIRIKLAFPNCADSLLREENNACK